MSILKPLKRLGVDTIIYGIGSVIQVFIGLLLFPIYTRVLSQADFGAQDLLMTFIVIINYFLIMGLDSGAARYYYDTDDVQVKKSYISTWLWFELALSIPIVFLAIIFAEPICKSVFSNNELMLPFRLAVISIPFVLVTRVINLTLRLKFQSKTFSILTGFGLLIQALAAIIFVVNMRMGVSGVFLAILCANIIQTIVGLAITANSFVPRFSLSYLKPMLAFGLPLVPASLSMWILNYSNRYFLSKWMGLEEVGLFGAAYRINALLVVGITAFQNAWPPFAFSLLNDETAAKKIYIQTLTYFVLAAMSAATILSIFSREALLVLATAKYEASYQLVPLLLYGSIAWGVVGIVAIACEIQKKSYQIMVATILGGFVTILVNVVFIPVWGLLAAAVATMAGNILAMIYIYRVGQHYFFVKYELSKIFKIVVITILAVIGGLFIDYENPVWTPNILLIKTPLFLILVFSLFVSRIVTQLEIDAVRTFVKQKFDGILNRG